MRLVDANEEYEFILPMVPRPKLVTAKLIHWYQNRFRALIHEQASRVGNQREGTRRALRKLQVELRALPEAERAKVLIALHLVTPIEISDKQMRNANVNQGVVI